MSDDKLDETRTSSCCYTPKPCAPACPKLPLCSCCMILRAKTGCQASMCPNCTFSPKTCSLSLIMDPCQKPRSPPPCCPPKCPPCLPSPLCSPCSPKCPPRCRSPCACPPRVPPSLLCCSSPPKPDICCSPPKLCCPPSPKLDICCSPPKLCCPPSPKLDICCSPPKPCFLPPSPCCPFPPKPPCCPESPKLFCVPRNIAMPPRCPRCVEVTCYSKISDARCDVPECPKPCDPCDPCPKVPPPIIHKCPKSVESEIPPHFTEIVSSPLTWETYGVRIKWTDPAAPGTCTVKSCQTIQVKLCLEVKPSSGLLPEYLSTACWTHMKTMCNPCGRWKGIPLSFQRDASTVDNCGNSRYVFCIPVTPTDDDTFKVSFNVKWGTILLWANNAAEFCC